MSSWIDEVFISKSWAFYRCLLQCSIDAAVTHSSHRCHRDVYLVLFRPGLAWKPWLWLGLTRLRLCQTSGQAKATNHGLAPAWPGLGPGFIYKLLRRHENFFLVKYIIYFYFLLHSTQIMSSCSKTKIDWYKEMAPPTRICSEGGGPCRATRVHRHG